MAKIVAHMLGWRRKYAQNKSLHGIFNWKCTLVSITCLESKCMDSNWIICANRICCRSTIRNSYSLSRTSFLLCNFFRSFFTLHIVCVFFIRKMGSESQQNGRKKNIKNSFSYTALYEMKIKLVNHFNENFSALIGI